MTNYSEQYHLLGMVILIVTIVYIVGGVIWNRVPQYRQMEIKGALVKVGHRTLMIAVGSAVIFFVCDVIMFNIK